jgi:hypothetical protein
MGSQVAHTSAAEHSAHNHPRPSRPRCPPPWSAPHMRTSEQIPEPRTAGSRAVGSQARIPAHHNPCRYQLHTQHSPPVLARSSMGSRYLFAQATAARASGQASPQQVARLGPQFFASTTAKAKQRCFTEFHQQLFGTLMTRLSSLTSPPAGTGVTHSALARLEVSHG